MNNKVNIYINNSKKSKYYVEVDTPMYRTWDYSKNEAELKKAISIMKHMIIAYGDTLNEIVDLRGKKNERNSR